MIKEIYTSSMLGKLIRNTDHRILVLAIVLSLPIKLGYVFSRNLFTSGPDADTYIPASIDFSIQGFFSSSITGMPYWPAGYPWLNSLFAKLSEGMWEETTQILQTIIFSLACLVYFNMILPYYGRSIALMSSLFLILQPAWVVANGEAMYETYLFSFLMIGCYLIIKANRKIAFDSIYMGLFLVGFTVVIHPRILPVLCVFLTLLQLKFRFRPKELLIGLIFFAFVPILFALRNWIAENSFTLSTALVGTASAYNVVFRSCSSIECIPATIFSNFSGFFSQGITNLSDFFSPHWGPDSKGTWFHNLSGLFLFPDGGVSEVIVFAGRFISTLSILFLILGIWKAIQRGNLFDHFFVISTALFLGTAFVIFGDNRHRLIASFSLLPLQLLGSRVSWDVFKKIYLKTLSLVK